MGSRVGFLAAPGRDVPRGPRRSPYGTTPPQLSSLLSEDSRDGKVTATRAPLPGAMPGPSTLTSKRTAADPSLTLTFTPLC